MARGKENQGKIFCCKPFDQLRRNGTINQFLHLGEERYLFMAISGLDVDETHESNEFKYRDDEINFCPCCGKEIMWEKWNNNDWLKPYLLPKDKPVKDPVVNVDMFNARKE